MQQNFLKFFLLLTLCVSALSCQKSFEYDVADIPYFEGLAAPAADEGYQLHVPPFPVPQQYERELFIRVAVGNTEDIYVKGFHALCRPGTHHLIAYGFEDENDSSNPPVGLMRDQNLPDGRGNFSLTMGSGAMYCGAQTPEFTTNFPDGVAVRIPANATIDINSHYFNLTNETIFGEVFLNLYTVPKEEVTELLEIEDIDNGDDLYLPPNETTVISYEETFDEPTQIRQLFAHMHKRGVAFEVFKVGGDNDGEMLYSSYDYQHPPYLMFDPPLEIDAGDGLRTEVRYVNETNRTITFGVTSEDEMGILFYYKVNN